MNKRKSFANLHERFNASGRRTSVDDPRSRAINFIHRNPGATAVHSSPSNNGLLSHATTQRDSTNVSAIHKSSVTRNEGTKLPKTRFDLARSWKNHTPRLEHFPVESVRKTVASGSYSPLSLHNIANQNMCKRVASTSTGTNANACASNLPDHEYGDTLKLCPTNVLVQQQPQGDQIQQSSEQVGIVDQQHIPTAQNVNRINQSEAMLHGRQLSAKQTHRPCVPAAVHGMPVKNMTPGKSAISLHSPAQQRHVLYAEERQQLPQNHASSAAAEQTQRTQVSTCQHVSQIARESTADQLRTKVPWEVDDSSNVCDYKLQPVGGGKARAECRASSPNKQLEGNERRDVATVPATGLAQDPCNALSVQLCAKDTKEHPHQKQLDQRHHHQQMGQQGQVNQGLSRLGFNYTRQSPQNVQQLYQQLQNNMISQQEIQRRALEHQEQIMVMAEQQVRQRPLAHELKTTVQQVQRNREARSNQYNRQEIYSGQSPNSSQHMHTDRISIPHYRMLMRHQNAGYGSSYITPQYSWMRDRNGIGHNPSFQSQLKQSAVDLVSPDEKKSILWNDMKRYEQLKQIKAPSTEDEILSQQQAGHNQWQQGTPYSQYEETMHHHDPIQHVRQSSNPLLYQQYPSVQPRRQGSGLLSQSSPIQHHSQQQSQTIKQFHSPGIHRVSQTAKRKYPEFTVEMIRDQELLVANMRQQHIPENIMSRQFDALLSEQRRHLAYFGGQELSKGTSDPSPRRYFRALHKDQRPDWMGSITPTQHCADVNQQDTRSAQRPHQTVHHMVNDVTPRYSLNSPYMFHIPHCQKACQLEKQQGYNKQCAIGLQPSTPCTSAALPHMVSPPQGTCSWSQQNFGPKSGPQCISVQCNNFQARPPRQLQQQESFQRLYKQQHETKQPQQIYHTQQQQQPMNSASQQTPQGVCITAEQHQEPNKVAEEKVNEKCDNLLSRESHNPCSLLKLREFRKYVRPQRQNNGLQDAETVKEAIEALKTSEARKGLEYVADLKKNVTTLKLNGTQDPSASENVSQPPVEYLQRLQERQQPKVSSNGLCNTRNVNNPAPAPIFFPPKIHPSLMAGYPRQNYAGDKQPQMNMAQSTHKMIAEKENGSVADGVQQDRIRTVLTGYDQSVQQHLPNRSNTADQYLPWQSGSIDGRCQWSTIPCDATNPIRSQRATTITPYKFDGSDPFYLQQIERFHRNRLNLRKVDQSGTAALTQQPGTLNEMTLVREIMPTSAGNTIQSVASCAIPNTWLDQIHQQKSCPARAMADNKNESYGATCTLDSNHGQPEIREPRTIGGLVYLAREVDYIQNPPQIAPNTLLASRFLQPFVGFN